MQDDFAIARDHYQAAISDPSSLLARIASALETLEGPPTAERLASFDQFHVGGLASSKELANRVSVPPEAHVLDAGSGLGGPSRYLAERFGCQVTGVDLAPAYVDIAKLLAEKAGMSERVRYVTASITDMPFLSETFDLVWTQHVVMNIRDRDGLYRELRRVLKRGGHFVFYDPYLPPDGEPPHYPTPWAETDANSTLLTRQQTVDAYRKAGLRLLAWDDVSEMGKAWIDRQQQQLQQAPAASGATGPTPGWVVGARMQPMVANFARNIREGRIHLVMGVCDAV